MSHQPFDSLFDDVNDTVFVEKRHDGNGLYFCWSRKGFGFGILDLQVIDGKLVVDDECMDTEFCLDIIKQAIEESKKA